MATPTGYKKLTAKFASTCRDCRGRVAVGETVLWKPGCSGVLHADASLCGRTVHDPYGREVGVAGFEVRVTTDVVLTDSQEADYLRYVSDGYGMSDGYYAPLNRRAWLALNSTPMELGAIYR